MDIQKCKVEKNREWSAAVVKGLAVTLGMSALVSLDGCASNAAQTGDDLAKSISPSPSLSELSSSSISDSSNANPSISSSSSVDSQNDQIKRLDSLDVDFDSKPLDSIKKNIDPYFDADGGIVEMYTGEIEMYDGEN